jgi:hypothetical protein
MYLLSGLYFLLYDINDHFYFFQISLLALGRCKQNKVATINGFFLSLFPSRLLFFRKGLFTGAQCFWFVIPSKI